jgi:hypothetical protein
MRVAVVAAVQDRTGKTLLARQSGTYRRTPDAGCHHQHGGIRFSTTGIEPPAITVDVGAVQFNPFLDAQIEVPRILLQVLQKLRAVWKVGVAGRHRQTGQPGYMLQRMQSQAVVMVMPRLADTTPFDQAIR